MSQRVLTVLPDLLDELSETASRATVRQREWGITAALEHYVGGGSPSAMARVNVEELLDPDFLEDYLESSATGRLRKRSPGPDQGNGESPRTTTARLGAIRWLAKSTGHAPPAPLRDDEPLLDATSTRLAADTRRSVLHLHKQPHYRDRRAAAMIALAASTATNSQYLAQLTTSQVHVHGERVYVSVPARRPLPVGWREDGDDTQAVLLPWAAAPVTGWLEDRARLVENLEGSDHGRFFVTCTATSESTPPGYPIQLRGLQRAHQRAVARLQKHFEDLDPPHRLSTVRRLAAVHWVKLPPAGDVTPE